MIKLHDAIARTLRDFGTQYVFGVSGANIEHLHDAIHRLGDKKLVSILAKSERGAAYMADARARVHHTLGVCCATSGGGMLNLACGIAESYAESVPVLAIVGQPPSALEGKGAFQDSSGRGSSFSAEALFSLISNYTHKVHPKTDLWDVLFSAITACFSGRPGPATLLIPRDLYELEVPDMPNDFIESLQQAILPNESLLFEQEAFLEAVKNLSNPVLIIGGSARKNGSAKEVAAFAKSSGIPTATSLSARAHYTADNANYLGTLGVAGNPSLHRYIAEEADGLIIAGTTLPIMTRQPILDALKDKTIIAVHEDKKAIENIFKGSLHIHANPESFFGEINKSQNPSLPNFAKIEDYKRSIFLPRLVTQSQETNGLLKQSDAIVELSKILPENGHLVFDAGNCSAACMHYTDVPKGTSSTIALGMGAMGYALGGAIGAQLGSPPGARTMAFIGDGAFLMEGLELHTAVELGLPILFVIFNNAAHGMCVTRQKLFFEGRTEASTYSEINVAQTARGLGDTSRLWVGRATTLAGLKLEIAQYQKNQHLPGVLELVLKTEEHAPFTAFLPPDAPTKDIQESIHKTLKKHRKKEPS